MRLLYTSILAAILAVPLTEAKALKTSQPRNPVCNTSEKLDFDVLFIQGKQFQYEVERLLTKYVSMPEEDWTCTLGDAENYECVQKYTGTMTCTVEKSEEKGKKGSKDYERKGLISCKSQVDDISFQVDDIAGCYILRDSGLFKKRTCDDSSADIQILSNPVSAKSEQAVKNEQCSPMYELSCKREGVWCTLFSSTCGPAMHSQVCYENHKGVISDTYLYAGDVTEEVSISLKESLPSNEGPKETKKEDK